MVRGLIVRRLSWYLVPLLFSLDLGSEFERSWRRLKDTSKLDHKVNSTDAVQSLGCPSTLRQVIGSDKTPSRSARDFRTLSELP